MKKRRADADIIAAKLREPGAIFIAVRYLPRGHKMRPIEKLWSWEKFRRQGIVLKVIINIKTYLTPLNNNATYRSASLSQPQGKTTTTSINNNRNNDHHITPSKQSDQHQRNAFLSATAPLTQIEPTTTITTHDHHQDTDIASSGALLHQRTITDPMHVDKAALSSPIRCRRATPAMSEEAWG